ncbi:hypothetical protein Tco_1255904 [Tanacetum coccineum]
MLATGRYAQWRSRFLRYIDTRPNGDALRKCILIGPYTPTIVTTPAVPATEDSPLVPEQTTVETVMNMTPENRAHFESEKEAIHLILTGIGDEIYSTVDACPNSLRNVEAIEKATKKTIDSARCKVNVQFLHSLQPEWSRFVTIVKQQHKLDEVSYHKLFDILKQYQKEVHELRAERMAKNANPLALVATAQTLQDPYYQTSKSHKSYAPTSKASLPTRSHATTRYKGKEIAKPITPPSESASEEDSDPEQASSGKDSRKFGSHCKVLQETLQTYQQQPQNFLKHQKQECGYYSKIHGKDSEVPNATQHRRDHWNSKSRQAYNVMTNNINHLKEIVNQAWVKHSNDLLHLRNPTAQDMEILVKTCLMPLALKTQNDSFAFVHELKQEMHADLKYVESLEDELDELESDKANFQHGMICFCKMVSKDSGNVTLAQKLSEQTEFVSKEIYTELLQSFAKLEKHSISLEIALQECQEQLKNDTVCKEKASNVFRKEREQYFEIQDLKAQLQDKNIAISELKKLIEKCKGKSVETQFDKPSIVRQPNA